MVLIWVVIYGLILLVAVVAIVAITWLSSTSVDVKAPPDDDRPPRPTRADRPLPTRATLAEERPPPNGTHYSDGPIRPDAAPMVEVIPVSVGGVSAIWGGTGRSPDGHIWMGLCAHGHGSAQLAEYDPERRRLVARGDVIAQLRKAGKYREGASQIKIHSKIVPGPDGQLYFTSMDEEGENGATGSLPVWGSHLWRLRLPERTWEHLETTKEALIAVSCAGQYVYALGYFGHVLYQYDPRNGSFRSQRVGSLGGHVSRNFFSDRRDHVYVPRLRPGRSPDDPAVVTLVEFDPRLRQVSESFLDHYLGDGQPHDSHGITGFQHMRDGSIVFVTHEGMLYRVVVPADGKGPANVEELGHFHPEGSTYVGTLFTFSGVRYVVGVAKTRRGTFDWLCFDLMKSESSNVEIELAYPDERPIWRHLLYGSITRDDAGGFYVAGTDQHTDRPVLIKLTAELHLGNHE